MPDPSTRLDSWKDIARYLRRDVSTVMRWERDRSLPVHRVPGGRVQRVYAYPEELNRWLAEVPPPEVESEPQPVSASTWHPASSSTSVVPNGRWRIALAVAATALIASGVGAAIALRERAGPVREVLIAGTELRAMDGAGRTRWVHQFNAAAIEPRRSFVVDVDRDGRNEIVAAVAISKRTGQIPVDELLCFSDDGQLRWSRTIGDRLRFRDQAYGPPWLSNDLLVYGGSGESRIAWAVHHQTWWPSLVVLFDAAGNRLGDFVSSGWVEHLGRSHDGRFLLATGSSNGRDAYFFGVLDSRNLVAASPEETGSQFECLTCPSGRPVSYFVFPRSDVSRSQSFPHGFGGPAIESFDDGRVQVRIIDSSDPHRAETIFEFTPEFDITQARVSDSFLQWHRQLEAEGRVTHLVSECPDRLAREVQRWTPADGWRTIRVPSR